MKQAALLGSSTCKLCNSVSRGPQALLQLGQGKNSGRSPRQGSLGLRTVRHSWEGLTTQRRNSQERSWHLGSTCCMPCSVPRGSLCHLLFWGQRSNPKETLVLKGQETFPESHT